MRFGAASPLAPQSLHCTTIGAGVMSSSAPSAMLPAAAMGKAWLSSAASIPDSIALWLPLIRGTLTMPTEQPSSATPAPTHKSAPVQAASSPRAIKA